MRDGDGRTGWFLPSELKQVVTNLTLRVDLPGGGWINFQPAVGEHVDRLVDAITESADFAVEVSYYHDGEQHRDEFTLS